MDDEAVARRVALVRLGRGWTQRELGEKIARSKDSVKQMETGRGLSSALLGELATALGVSYGYLAAGIAQEADIAIIIEGARQEGWDRAVQAMRDALEKEVRRRGA